jgi:hypothetical protein
MLCTNSYPADYVDRCRTRVDAQVTAYNKLVSVARRSGGGSKAALDGAVGSFDQLFFSNMVLTLDTYFMHRSRTIEGKTGNPVNEVRILCSSITGNDGVFTLNAADAVWNPSLKSDKTIRYKPGTSVLGYQVGDEIKLSEADFVRLADAYFAAITEMFG